MTMTDEELDRDWKPNGRRPQSTIARMFSDELMDIFRIDNSVADLDEQVDKRKQQINSQTSELEALEARIREMEKRLKLQGNSNTPGNDSGTQDHATSSHNLAFRPAPPEKDYPAGQNLDREQQQQQQQQKYGGSRPGTARQSQQAVPGALPPTPVGSEGECDPPVARPLRSPPRPSGTQAQPYPGRSSASVGRTSPSTMRRKPIPSRDSDSTTSASESSTVADYVLVPEPDGDRDRHV